MFIFLTIMLIAGAIFLLVPIRTYGQHHTSLKITPFQTKDIKAIITFVSTSKKGDPIENLLAYKVLSLISSNNSTTKYAWLIHGDISDKEGASYYNTFQLARRFRSDKLKIQTYGVENVFDIQEVFSLANKILTSDNFGINPKHIVCDCTSGTKLATLGIALATIKNGRLIYFPPKGDTDEPVEYIEIDTGIFVDTINLAEEQ